MTMWEGPGHSKFCIFLHGSQYKSSINGTHGHYHRSEVGMKKVKKMTTFTAGRKAKKIFMKIPDPGGKILGILIYNKM